MDLYLGDVCIFVSVLETSQVTSRSVQNYRLERDRNTGWSMLSKLPENRQLPLI